MNTNIAHPYAAGIDLGSRTIYVCAPDGKVQTFACFTADLQAAVTWLQEKQTKTVAMESTGVYWVVLYDLLEAAGLEVYLVNARALRRSPGRKSDMADCQWIQYLHKLGILTKSHIAPEQMRVLRQYIRQREHCLQAASEEVNMMHKALTLMNLQLHHVISRVQDGSGMRVLRAILSGQRDANELLALCDVRIRKNKAEEVLKALVGNYRAEHLFALAQAVKSYDFFMAQMAECDAQIQTHLGNITAEDEPDQKAPDTPEGGDLPALGSGADKASPARRKAIRHHSPKVDNLGKMLLKLTGGQDPTQLPGITDLGLLRLLAIIGTDLSPWPTAGHFTAWLKLVPITQQSGKTRRNQRTRRNHAAAQVFREAAQTIGSSKHIALGTFYRKIRARSGAKVANVATARKLAILFYNTLKHGLAFVEEGILQAEQKAQKHLINALERKAQRLGFNLVPQTA